MEKYTVGMTGPPIDWLLKRDSAIIDPSTATAIVVNFKIKDQDTIKFTRSLAAGEVSIVVDDSGNNRIRVTFASSNLDTAGIYQAKAVITWPDFSETSPDSYDFYVEQAW